MWKEYNPNPQGNLVGDCVIRAIAKAEDLSWDDAFLRISLQAYCMKDIPSANRVWGQYLQNHGYRREWLPDDCPACYTVEQFAKEHPQGTYILALDGHVVTIVDGDWNDSWDSKSRTALYAWHREEE